MNPRGVLESVRSGMKGQVLCYVRPSKRSPARDFRQKMPEHLRQKFNHTFRQLCAEGITATATKHQVIAPLTNGGKGLWSFKEHDHRFYAFRAPTSNGVDRMVLLMGYVKDKTESLTEDRAVVSALRLMEECEKSVDWNAEPVPYGSTKLDESPLTLGEVFAPDLEKAREMQEEFAEKHPKVAAFVETPSAGDIVQVLNQIPGYYEPLTVKALSEITSVQVTTLRTWIARKKLPPAVKNGHMLSWSATEAPMVVTLAKELAAKDQKFPTKKQDVQVEKVLSRKELSRLLGSVIDGRAKAETLVLEIEKHKLQVQKAKAELRRLVGKG